MERDLTIDNVRMLSSANLEKAKDGPLRIFNQNSLASQ